MKIITIWNLKGGTGKTTTTFNLAANYAKDGMKILLIDLDMQANLTSFFDADIARLKTNKPDIAEIMTDVMPLRKGIYHSRFSNIDFVKGSNELTSLELKDVNVLGRYLADVADEYDMCMIDCHPDVSLTTENALAISDLVLIPIILDGMTKELISLENRCGEINFKIFVNQLRNLKSQKIIYRDLCENHDYSVMNTSIADCSAIKSALIRHKPLYMHKSRCPVNEDYSELATEILESLEVK